MTGSGSKKDKSAGSGKGYLPGLIKRKNGYEYMNREISWLSFNARVMQEAADPSVPLFERLKFLGISSSNLDEFFSVRVGTLRRLIDAGVTKKGFSGESPKKTLVEIQETVLEHNGIYTKLYDDLQEELRSNGVLILTENQLDQDQLDYLDRYFRENVRPKLVPLMLCENNPFPYLENHVIYFAIDMHKKDDPEDFKFALMEVPTDVLPRYIILPSPDSNRYVIMLDDIIRLNLDHIFSIFDYDSISAYTIKITRDAELDIEDDVTKSFYEKISQSLKAREKGRPVRFIYDDEMPHRLLKFILDKMNLTGFENLIPGGRYHNSKDLMKFPKMGIKGLEYDTAAPLSHPDLSNKKSLLKVIGKKDVLLHFPYHPFGYFIDILREAAIDPAVVSIKISLYRVAKNSDVINALINAIGNGKDVTVIVELRARFDESANIYWTRKLRDAGAKIIHGVPGLKVHSKLCLISREEGKHMQNYAAVGTGNFNESTAKLYSDHLLLTSDRRITSEVVNVFDFLEHNYKRFDYEHLLLAPNHLRYRLIRLIDNEISNAVNGKEAYIHAKLNSLVDREIIDKLYEASRAGVKIRMVVRGICSLVPGEKGLSENIEVISIVDKYLEHSRIHVFCNGGDEKYYISSADWMVRNLDNRVEVGVPIYDPEVQKEIRTFLDIQFNDSKKARIINKKQDNPYKQPQPDLNYRSQDDIYNFLKNKYDQAGEQS